MHPELKYRRDFISADGQAALSAEGEYFFIGDEVGHEGAHKDERALIQSFRVDKESMDVIADTDKGFGRISYMYKEGNKTLPDTVLYGNLLKQYLRKTGIKQSFLAKKLGIDSGYFSRILSNTYVPSEERMKIIVSYFSNISEDEKALLTNYKLHLKNLTNYRIDKK